MKVIICSSIEVKLGKFGGYLMPCMFLYLALHMMVDVEQLIHMMRCVEPTMGNKANPRKAVAPTLLVAAGNGHTGAASYLQFGCSQTFVVLYCRLCTIQIGPSL
jgi:hypothetical protein